MKLSKNERLIVWGLVKYPMLNDRELSDEIGVRMSTLNANKNKMKRNGLIYDRIVPNVELMDYELLSVSWCPLTRTVKDKKDIGFIKDLFSKFPNTYTCMVLGDTLFFLSLYKNYTQHLKCQIAIENPIRERGLMSLSDPHTTIYPLETSKITKNFDYAAVLERAFGIEPPHKGGKGDDRTLNDQAREKIFNLTKKEKLILRGILETPDMPDNRIATMLDTTRQAVARHKRELLDLNIIKKTRIIDSASLGFNVLCLVEGHYRKFGGPKKDTPDISTLNLPSFFSVYGQRETASLSLFRDFQHYAESREMYYEAMRGFCEIINEPHIQLFSPTDTVMIKHQEYLPLVVDFLNQN